MKNFFMLITALIILSSCISDKKYREFTFSEAPLYGMIYDYDNQPVSGVTVSINSGQKVKSDINGRFVLTDIRTGLHKIKAEKEYYESLEYSFDFLNRTQVLYIKIFSHNQLLKLAETEIEKRNYAQAEMYLKRAADADRETALYLYLKAVLLYKQEDYQAAAALLEKTAAGPYKNKTIFLFLADIYEYCLDDKNAAAEKLEKYLKSAEDPAALARLKALQLKKE